jgi:hypothetical protein
MTISNSPRLSLRKPGDKVDLRKRLSLRKASDRF